MAQDNTTLDDISAVIGLSATVRLAAWFGGLARLYVPETVDDGQLLVKLVGMPAARRMTAEWGGLHLTVPRLTNYEDEMMRNLIGRMIETGFKVREIARHTRMSQRRVQQVCRDLEIAGLIKIIVPDKTEDEDSGAMFGDGLLPLRGTLFPTARLDDRGCDFDNGAPNGAETA